MQRGMPDIRRDKFEANVILDKEEFAHQAIARQSPFIGADASASGELPKDLRIAISKSVQRRSEIVHDREERLVQLRQLTARLEPLRARLDACKCATAMQIAAKFSVAWTSAVIDAMQWPDIELLLRYVKGHETVFNIRDSGVSALMNSQRSPMRRHSEMRTRA